MKNSITSPYKMKDSILNYDTTQYQELMKNFENLIKVTQEKLHSNQKKLEETCQCSFEDQFIAVQQENEDLKRMIDELKNYQELQQINLKEQFQHVVEDYTSKSIQQNRLIEDLQNKLYEAQQNLINEKNRHNLTVQKLQEMQEEYLMFKQEKKKQQFYEFEVTEKITQGYSDLTQENQKLRSNEKYYFQEIEKLKIALNQSYVALSKHEFKIKQKFSLDSSYSTTETQTEAIVYDQRESLKERINSALQNLEKNLINYSEKKKLRNKSANELKFYSDFQEWIQTMKNEFISLRNQVNTLQRDDQDLKENILLIQNQHLKQIKESEEQIGTLSKEVQYFEEQLKLSEKTLKEAKVSFEKEKRILTEEVKSKMLLHKQLESENQSSLQLILEQQSENNFLKQENKTLQTTISSLRVEITDLKQQLLLEQAQSSQAKPQLLENSYMSTKIEDLELILKDKDQKMEDLEKLYHLTSYELRTLQDYQQSLENECQILKQEIKRQQSILDEQNQTLQNYEQLLSARNKVQQNTNETIPSNKSTEALQQNGQPQDNQQSQNKIQVKILSGDIQRLNQTIKLNQKKIQDLEYILDKIINTNKENKLLARQIYLQATQTGRVIGQNIQDIISYNETENVQPQDSFEIMVQNLKNQTEIY